MSKLVTKLLNELVEEIDITDSQEGVVRRAYNSVADWLNQSNTYIAHHKIRIFPQGSMMYGTAIKPIEEDDYDIDLVCEFTAQTNGLLPEYVKKAVGQRLKDNNTYCKMLETEGRRCWTLQYSDTLNFHMDILPAIPFNESYKTDIKLNEAYNSMAICRELALLATDKDKKTQEYEFIPTNPRGYAEWFKNKTQIKQRILMQDSIERLPKNVQKTILQKAIQLLKRHRDVYFAQIGNDEVKPISMIITTLATHCYSGEQDLYDFLCKAVKSMPLYIERINGEHWIKNPVMTSENFADKWKENPAKAKAFFDWIDKAQRDFLLLSNIQTYSEFEITLKRLFAQKPVDRLMRKYNEQLQKEKNTSVKPATITALESIPHRVSPPWVLPRSYRVQISAKASFDNGISFTKIESGHPLPKGVELRFSPIHDIHPKYKVKWQITNTGTEATRAHCLRGNTFEDGDFLQFGIPYIKKEITSYTGTHFVQCFIIKNGNQCVGVSEPFVVKIK